MNKLPTAANGYNLPQSVAPNQEVELKVVATAPGSAGTYDTRWVITNPEGVNFAAFDLTINVVQGTSSSGTEATATGVPSVCDDAGTISVNQTATSSGGAVTVDSPGGQVRVYFYLKSGTTAGKMIIAETSTEWGTASSSFDVTSTSEGYVGVGKPSKQGNKLSITAETADVVISKVVWWKSNSSCN
jgi:hypothetical protein